MRPKRCDFTDDSSGRRLADLPGEQGWHATGAGRVWATIVTPRQLRQSGNRRLIAHEVRMGATRRGREQCQSVAERESYFREL